MPLGRAQFTGSPTAAGSGVAFQATFLVSDCGDVDAKRGGGTGIVSEAEERFVRDTDGTMLPLKFA